MSDLDWASQIANSDFVGSIEMENYDNKRVRPVDQWSTKAFPYVSPRHPNTATINLNTEILQTCPNPECYNTMIPQGQKFCGKCYTMIEISYDDL